ncbi:MAG: hypothetical protein A2Z20_05840 [Bdellovibrionales bacterium RBG_16_40_8]|nr:MAG: hypothetical protein A2Z20_05840 [Bdellovibrionales bacterium RBG_16_40_8]
MRRIWVDPDIIKGPTFELIDEAFHHVIHVSRFRVGEEFEILSGDTEALRVHICEIKKKSVQVEIIGRRKLPEIKRPYVNLAFALPKWNVFEEVIEKSVELAVSEIQPLFTEHSFTRALRDWSPSRVKRFDKIIKSATEQTGRGQLLKIRRPLDICEFVQGLNQNTSVVGLFTYEGEKALSIKFEISRLIKSNPQEVWAIVGSEGGFSDAEVRYMKENGLPPVTMGNQILRADTACIAAISVIKYECGLMS